MLVRLFVLGVIYEHDSHGYEIKATAKLWGLERWAKIGFGSIYHALGALEREGLIAQRGVLREGRAPAKAVYSITAEGRAVFLEMLRQAFRSPGSAPAEVDLAMAFAPNLPAEEREALVRERLAVLTERCADLTRRIERVRREYPAVPWIGKSLEHHLLLSDAERRWTEDLAGSIGSFPLRDWSEIKFE